RGRNRILLARRDFFPTLDQFIGAFAEFARFALRVFLAFVGFFRKKIARLFAGLRRKYHAHQGANTKTHNEVRHLGTYVVRHDNLQTLPSHRSIAKVRLQWWLTGMGDSKRLLAVRMIRGVLQARENFFGIFPRNNRAQFFHASSLNVGDASEFLQQFLSRSWSDAGDFVERTLRLPLSAALAVKGHCEAMRLVANLLDQMED